MQWVTGGKATKHKGDEDKDDVENLGPRPVKNDEKKWTSDHGEMGEKGDKR